MQRRDFLRLAGAAAVIPRDVAAAPAVARATTTVLYDDRSTVVQSGPANSRTPDALWVHKRDLPKINDFELKPQGACREDLCIPIPRDLVRGAYFDLTAFARKISEPVVADRDARVWSFGEMQALGGGFLASRVAPDFTVGDRKGRPVHLADFRGKKVLLVTWASW